MEFYLRFGVDYGVMAILCGMSVLSLALFIERLSVYKSIDPSNFKSRKSFELALSNHVGIIETITSSAPYIGLLGTVLAIMVTFMGLSENGLETLKIMADLALALKATALGLVVAIVSMMFNNTLVRQCERLLVLFDEKI